MPQGDTIGNLLHEMLSVPGTAAGKKRGAEIAIEIIEHFISASCQQDVVADKDACSAVATILEMCANKIINNADAVGGSDGLYLAISGCDAALTITDRVESPELWASVHVTRASALLSLGRILAGVDGENFLLRALHNHQHHDSIE